MTRYGDEYHSAVPLAVTRGPAISWVKSGAVRAVLSIDGVTIPLWNYDRAIAARGRPLLKRSGRGVNKISLADARAVLVGELEDFAAIDPEGVAMEAVACAAGEFPETLQAEHPGKTAADLIAEGLVPGEGAERPYHWYKISKRDWLAAADAGVSVEYAPARGIAWRWCAHARAREIAAAPLSADDYRAGLRAAIAACS